MEENLGLSCWFQRSAVSGVTQKPRSLAFPVDLRRGLGQYTTWSWHEFCVADKEALSNLTMGKVRYVTPDCGETGLGKMYTLNMRGRCLYVAAHS